MYNVVHVVPEEGCIPSVSLGRYINVPMLGLKVKSERLGWQCGKSSVGPQAADAART